MSSYWVMNQSPSNNPVLGWEETFHQRKAMLAKQWDSDSEYVLKKSIARLLYYSSWHEIVDVSEL